MISYPTPGMSHGQYEAALRAALAGLPVMTPIECIIFMGGDADNATPEQLEMAAWDLRTHGYTLEMIRLKPYAEPVERYVRRQYWPEDDQWPP